MKTLSNSFDFWLRTKKFASTEGQVHRALQPEMRASYTGEFDDHHSTYYNGEVLENASSKRQFGAIVSWNFQCHHS